MTDFETHPVGTDDLVKRLRECSSDEAMWSREAADRIEQLEAALTRANAATAAAYERAADVCADYPRNSPDYAEWTRYDEQIAYSQECIRALATPDQTAALYKLIAEAVKPYVEAMRYYETQFCEGFCEDMPDRSVTNEGMENDCSGCKARAILAASKKGGA